MADFDGDTGDNTLTGTAGSDRLRGFAGNDKLIGNAGADILDGGDGEDTASYATATAAVKVNLVAGSEPNTGDAAGDTYVSIENLIGSDFGDYLAGNDANNKIWGARAMTRCGVTPGRSTICMAKTAPIRWSAVPARM